jgi:hypothetical protein
MSIYAKSDSGSDEGLKSKAVVARDATPLLDGQTLLAFRNMQLTSSESLDEELKDAAKLVSPETAEPAEQSKPKKPSAPISKTFENVPADFNMNAPSGSDEEDREA